MASGTDPLLALRAAIKSKHKTAYTPDSSGLILSPTLTVPKSAPTRLRKPGSTSADPAAAPTDFFSIEAVYLAWRLRDAPGADYMRQAREHGLALGFVSVTERKGVVDWLEGRVAEHERIVPLIGELAYPNFGIVSPHRSCSRRHDNTTRHPTASGDLCVCVGSICYNRT